MKQEEYDAFYKQVSRDIDDPLKTIHVAAEGATGVPGLMFIPAHRGMDWMMGPEKKSGSICMSAGSSSSTSARNCSRLICGL